MNWRDDSLEVEESEESMEMEMIHISDSGGVDIEEVSKQI